MSNVDRMDLPVLPVGFTVRPARLEDTSAAHEIVRAHHLASGGHEAPAREEVASDLAFPSLDRERDTWLVHDADGVPALYGIVYCDRPGRTYFDLYVEPRLPRPTRFALATAIGKAAIQRVLEDAERRGLTRTIAETGMVLDDELLPEVFRALEFEPARLWWLMTADAATIRAARSAPPHGFRFERGDLEDDAVMRRVMDLDDETFSEHYGYLPNEWDDYVADIRHGAGYDAGALWFAIDEANGETAAFMVADDSRLEHDAGYVDTLGVRKSYRGKGLAGALLRAAFAEYAARGRTAVSLEVDTENATGAVAVYERVGMKAVETAQSWERVIDLSQA